MRRKIRYKKQSCIQNTRIIKVATKIIVIKPNVLPWLFSIFRSEASQTIKYDLDSAQINFLFRVTPGQSRGVTKSTN